MFQNTHSIALLVYSNCCVLSYVFVLILHTILRISTYRHLMKRFSVSLHILLHNMFYECQCQRLHCTVEGGDSSTFVILSLLVPEPSIGLPHWLVKHVNNLWFVIAIVLSIGFLNRFTFCCFPLRLLSSAIHRFTSNLLRVRLFNVSTSLLPWSGSDAYLHIYS